MPPVDHVGPGKKPVVMVVDDDFSARIQMRAALENFGFTVSEAANGLAALDNFKKQPPELVLLDVLMPELDGFETCRRIRTLPGAEHTPVVMVTGLEDIESIHRAFETGATDFIGKPINWTILGYRVRYWLRSGTTLHNLDISQKRLSKAQHIARLGHWERDLKSGHFNVSTQIPQLLGISDPSRYEGLFELIVPEDKGRVMEMIDSACRTEKPFSINYRVRLPDGTEGSIHNQGEIDFDEARGSALMLGTVQDITEMKEAEDQIRYLAFYDNLTGLANRSLFREHWSKVVSHAQRKNSKVAIIFLDLDHFKRINDTMGHPAGDKLLKTIAERLKQTLRTSDILARPALEDATFLISRLGGDEFTILAEDITSLDHVTHLAQRLNKVISRPLTLENQEISVTASIGISLYPEDGEDIDILLKNADTAMYEAKGKGRNNYQFFQKDMNDAAQARFNMENSLNNALEKNEFILYYQPQFESAGLQLTGAEALLRWHHPEWGMVPPDKFLPFAEESGFIHKINDWVIEEACRQARAWVGAGFFSDCRVAVNISGNNINFKTLTTTVIEILKRTGLEPHYLEIELTERVMMENTSAAVIALREFKEMGISIAIDDFGTGYSALSHLQIFPLTTLKIDKSFVQNIETAGNNLSLLQAIIGIAKGFDLRVVAEGVETEEQYKNLLRMKCDDLQGFLLGRPVPNEELEEKMRSGAFENFIGLKPEGDTRSTGFPLV